MNTKKSNFTTIFEASLLDRINMTENQLEFDRIKMTMMSVNVGT